jgi:hypothetical protein
MKIKEIIGGVMLILAGALFGAAQEQPIKPVPAAPVLAEVKEEFDGDALDAKKWEQYSLNGVGKIKLEKGKLQTSGATDSRAGIRSVPTFTGERFLVSAKIAKVSAGLSSESRAPLGNAILTILFDNAGVTRLEWLMTHEGRFEAWLIRDGKSERLDGNNLGTKEKSPTLGIGRRGEDYFFMLNGEVGLQKNIKNLPLNFRVMLYGFGTSKDEWESVSIITPEQK